MPLCISIQMEPLHFFFKIIFVFLRKSNDAHCPRVILAVLMCFSLLAGILNLQYTFISCLENSVELTLEVRFHSLIRDSQNPDLT
jgi:hypothetical protein